MTNQGKSIIWKAFEAIKIKEGNDIYRDYILAIFLLKYLCDKSDIETKRSIFSDSNIKFEYIYKNKDLDNIGKSLNQVFNIIDEKLHFNGVLSKLDFDSDTYLGRIDDRNSNLWIALEEMKKLDFSRDDSLPADIFNYFIDAVEYYYRNLRYNFTPIEVVQLICGLVDLKDKDTIYDPDCGYGSLLSYASKNAGGGKVFGQVGKENLYLISKINMLINGIEDGDIQLGNVISNPKHLDGDKLKKFDVAISNPGLMRGKWTSLFGGKFTTDPYERFDYGVPGENQVEFVYIFHMLKSLNDHGRMAILTTPSVLFREGSEGIIRKNLIDNNLIDAIVALPPNLMANTAIPYIIIAFKKNRERRDLLMFDLSSTTDHVEKEGVIKKRLRKESVDKVIKSYKAYEGIDKLSRLVGIDEIKSNDYNLNIPRYILSNDPSDETDLNKRCKEINKLELELRKVQKEIDELIKKS